MLLREIPVQMIIFSKTGKTNLWRSHCTTPQYSKTQPLNVIQQLYYSINTLLISQIRTMIAQHIVRKIKHKNKKQSMFMYVHRKFLQRKEKKKRVKVITPILGFVGGLISPKRYLKKSSRLRPLRWKKWWPKLLIMLWASSTVAFLSFWISTKKRCRLSTPM